MADRAISAVRSVISRLGLKAPWKLTGVASSPEFLSAAPAATEWRKNSPGSPALKAIVPHADAEHVYDIRYWVRDTRREGMLVGGTNKKHVVTYNYKDLASKGGLEGQNAPLAMGKPFRWAKTKDLLDVDNNGYT